jgi:hypothetical protein
MPQITVIVCVYGDRQPLSRLLARSADCYDELLVVHDGPDFEDVRSLVVQYGGRFVERPRAFSQEPHFPFAFGEATHDWILRLDSDEFPSTELRNWLIKFRHGAEPASDVSVYQCIWPVWNGSKAITHGWPNKRTFLFHRHRIRWIGVSEHGALPDGRFIKVPLILCHEPKGASLGFRNIFGKKRTDRARKNNARALLDSPLDHPRWRYDSAEWPQDWQHVKDHPIVTGLWRLFFWPPRQALAMLLAGDLPRPSIFMHAGVFHATICFEFWRQRCRSHGK